MTKIYKTPQSGSLRRWFKQVFASLIKRQDRNCIEKVFEELRDIRDLIEVIAREIARQSKRGK